MIEAKIICDSVNAQGNRLTTFQLRYPKFIHGEFMTHRVFSRNASSSRAIPTAKLLEEVRSDALRAAPIWWGKNQSGMQAAKELSDTRAERLQYSDPDWVDKAISDRQLAMNYWSSAAKEAALQAQRLMDVGVHKQIVNRLLEPFSHINVICTATEYANFFGLRLDKAAQPEMRALSLAMWQEYENSNSKLLKPGEWHLPFVRPIIPGEPLIDDRDFLPPGNSRNLTPHDQMIRISVARCARVSYQSFFPGNKRSTVREDLELYDRLLGAQPLHASPAEHQATPDTGIFSTAEGLRDLSMEIPERWNNWHQHGNFKGWRQYRKMLPGEAVAPLPKEYER